MLKKNMLRLIIGAITVTSLWAGTVSTYASDAAEEQDTVSSTFIGNRRRLNVELRATYSSNIVPTDNDLYCITVQRQLNANEDPETVDLKHINVNASVGIRGCMDPGWYDVVGIRYLGTDAAMQTTPVATNSTIRVYTDEPTTIPLSIGAQAINKLKEKVGEGNVYFQQNGDSEYRSDSTLSAFQEVEEMSVYDELNVFGDDEEAKQRYLKYLENEELVNEKYQYTDKAKTLFEENPDENLEIAGADVLTDDGNVAEFEVPYEPVTEKPNISGESDESSTNTSGYESDGDDNVKTKHFDNKEESVTEKEAEAHPVLVFVIKYLPLLAFFIGLIVVFMWYKRQI